MSNNESQKNDLRKMLFDLLKEELTFQPIIHDNYDGCEYYPNEELAGFSVYFGDKLITEMKIK